MKKRTVIAFLLMLISAISTRGIAFDQENVVKNCGTIAECLQSVVEADNKLAAKVKDIIDAMGDKKNTLDYTNPGFVFSIDKDVTIDVPGRFNDIEIKTIQEALKALRNYRILSGVTVTIRLNQDAVNYDTINVDHPEGGKIHIVGNCSEGKNCTIIFKQGVHGVYVANGNRLGYLDKLNLVGQGGEYGILASGGSNINCGPNITVQKFISGIQAEIHSVISARGIRCEYNSWDGIRVTYSSTIFANNAVVRYSGASAIYMPLGCAVVGKVYLEGNKYDGATPIKEQ